MAVSAKIDKLRACADRALECADDFVTNQLTIRLRQWSGPRRGGSDGVFHDTDLALPKKYPMRQARDRDVLTSGGRVQVGDLIVEQIVPPFTVRGGGGFSAEQLVPQNSFRADDRSREVIYIVTGDISGRYTFVDINQSDPIFWTLTLRRTRDLPRLGEVA